VAVLPDYNGVPPYPPNPPTPTFCNIPLCLTPGKGTLFSFHCSVRSLPSLSFVWWIHLFFEGGSNVWPLSTFPKRSPSGKCFTLFEEESRSALFLFPVVLDLYCRALYNML